MGRKIFVNYRRDDSAAHALNIAQYLEREFGASNVFIDVDRIRSGQNFPEVLGQKLKDCAVLIAVIGPSWLAVKDDAGRRRIEDPEDWVRLEIEQALARQIPVIPVLVSGASLPKKSELPEELRPLLQRHASTVTTNGFRHEMSGLASDIRALLPRNRIRPLTYAALGLLAIAGIGGVLYRQAGNESPPPTPPGPSDALKSMPGTVISTHKDWQVRCGLFGDPPKNNCVVVQSVVAEERPNVGMTVIALWSTERKLMLRVVAPVGVLMSAGLGLKIDSEDIGKAGFTRCTVDGCVAEVIVDEQLLGKLKTGKIATFAIFETPTDGIGFPIPLSGFAEALAALPS